MCARGAVGFSLSKIPPDIFTLQQGAVHAALTRRGRIDADAAISAEFAPTGAGQGCADQPHDEQQPRGGKQRTSSAPGIGFAHREQTTVLLG